MRPIRLGVFCVAVCLSGCAAMKSHDALTDKVQAAQQAGGLNAAIKQLESTASSADEKAALLYNLELGELYRQNRQYGESTTAWLRADQKVQEWEATAKTSPGKLLGFAGAGLLSERLKGYEGQDYEKVWLTTRLALNRIAQGDWETARVDVKRTHEREAVIAELRAKEVVAAEQEASSKGIEKGGKEINGYPVETLNDPEVLKLRNGYQNALSHYLSGFLYEALNEPGLAAPGYRKAIELSPDRVVLEEGLRGLDSRTSPRVRQRQRMTDVLFVLEAGDAPARKEQKFSMPVPVGSRVIVTTLAYPVIQPAALAVPAQVVVGNVALQAEKVVDLNVMARRALRDEMPGMVARSITRAIAKGVAQDQLQKAAGPWGPLAGLVGAVATSATEQADDRLWRSLPGVVAIARGYVPQGEHPLLIDGLPTGATVQISGQYALIPMRLQAGVQSVGQVATFGQLAPLAAVQPAPTPTKASTTALEAAEGIAKPKSGTKPRRPALVPVATTP